MGIQDFKWRSFRHKGDYGVTKTVDGYGKAEM